MTSAEFKSHAGLLTEGWGGSERSPRHVGSLGVLPLPIEFVCDLVGVTYRWPPWLTGSYHPRSHLHTVGAGERAQLLQELQDFAQ
jgi:hypothetical protein